MPDKRTHKRHFISGYLTIDTEDNPSVTYKVELSDVCFGGVAVYSKERIELAGKPINFKLQADIWEGVLSGKGKINYIKEEKRHREIVFRMGLEFAEIDKSSVLQFLDVVHHKIALKSRQMKQAAGKKTTGYTGLY